MTILNALFIFRVLYIAMPPMPNNQMERVANIEMNLTPNNNTNRVNNSEIQRITGVIGRIPDEIERNKAYVLLESVVKAKKNVRDTYLQELLGMLNDHGLSNNVLRGGRARRTQRKKRTLRKKRVQRKTRR
jgi:hypothetical protein